MALVHGGFCVAATSFGRFERQFLSNQSKGGSGKVKIGSALPHWFAPCAALCCGAWMLGHRRPPKVPGTAVWQWRFSRYSTPGAAASSGGGGQATGTPQGDGDLEIDWEQGPSLAYARRCDRELLSLAVPATLGASIDPILSLVDTYWVASHLGTVALASLGPALNIEDWLFDILKSLQVPVRSTAAKAIASGRRTAITVAVEDALLFACRIGLLVAVTGTLGVSWLLRLSAVGSTSPLFQSARAYLLPRLWGTPALLVLITLQAVLSGAFRDTRAVLRLLLLGGAVNAVLTPALVVGLNAGTGGAALATSIACYVAATAAWKAVSTQQLPQQPLQPQEWPTKQREGQPFQQERVWMPAARPLLSRVLYDPGKPSQSSTGGINGEPEQGGWRALLRANAALSVRSFASLTTWLAASALLTLRTDVVTVAAHLCMAKSFLMLLNVLYGLQLATQVLVSGHVARGASRLARWTALRCLRLGMIVSSILAASLWHGRGMIPKLLSSDQAIATGFADMAFPAATILFLYGALWILDGVLYGLGDYVWIATCTCVAAAAATGAMVLVGHTGQSVWWCLCTMTVLRTIAVIHRIFFSPQSPLVVATSSHR